MRSLLRSQSLLILLSMILVLVTLVAPQAEAKNRECTGAEMALLYNFKEMSFSIVVLLQDENEQIDFFTSRYSDFIMTESTSSPNAISLKNQINALKSKVLGRKQQIDSLDKQSRAVLSKCTTTTVEQLQSSKTRKVCTSNEKKAINSVIASFRSVQDKKRLWDGKKRVAEAWMSDWTRPSSIQANARMDFNTYSRYYEIEEVKESLVINQFEFLNASCRNSGLYLPRAYTPLAPAPTPTPTPNSNKGVYLIDWRFNYNSTTGGFTSEQRPDGSVIVQCKDGNLWPYPKWKFPIGLSLDGAKLLVTGSSVKDDLYTNFIGEYLGRIKNTLVPVERIDVLGAKFGRDPEFRMDEYKLYHIIGKSIGFSADGSICGLTTEPLSNLKQTLASDIQTAALFLLIKTDQNPIAILIGSFEVLSAAEKATAEKAAAEKAAAAKKAAAEKAAAEKATAARCALSGVDCRVGDTGPGGGIVFYDAGSQQSWGRYLEFAPNDWSGNVVDPKVVWCNVVDIPTTARPTEIGKGRTNTDLMLANCSSGAATVARSYRGGAKNDWFLPSRDELNELCKYAKYQATGDSKILCERQTSDSTRKGFVNDSDGGYYWSSSDGSKSGAWKQNFANGIQDSSKQYYFNYVRPVRAF